MIFKTKIGYYTGTTDGYTDDEAQQFIVEGCYDVYRKFKAIKGFDEQQRFGVFSAGDTSGNALNIDEINEIFYVQRNGIPATQVSVNQVHKYTDTGSIHYASINDPIFYIQEDNLYVKPVSSPSAGAVYYLYLPQYAVTSYTSASSSIDKFPAEYYDYVLVYAAIKLLEQLYHNYIEDDEDSELAQLMAGRMDRLKLQYNEMFGGMNNDA